MTANENGRHCVACCKTVVDFTAMTDEELCNFFLQKKEEKICGIFKNAQLHRTEIALPPNIFNVQMPWWKSFLVASLVVFGATLFSCNTSIKGELNTESFITADTIMTMGLALPPLPLRRSEKSMPKQYPDSSCTATTKGIMEIRIVEDENIFMGKPFTVVSPDTSKHYISNPPAKQEISPVAPNKTNSSSDSSFIKNPRKADSIK
ncbi:MAG: hypothetical protein ABIN01_17400 [Ferruginibacter sp.]